MTAPVDLKGINAFLLGVTGGIASGKSTASAMLVEMGAPAIDFDILARKVVEPGTPGLAVIADQFGTGMLNPDGSLNRAALAEVVFPDPAKRKRLEAILHPRINRQFEVELKSLVANQPGAVIQLVIPLLYESDMAGWCHKVLLVLIPPEAQIERLMIRDGISRKQAADRLASQIPIERKRELADFVVDNTGSLDETKAQLARLWPRIQALAAQRSAS